MIDGDDDSAVPDDAPPSPMASIKEQIGEALSGVQPGSSPGANVTTPWEASCHPGYPPLAVPKAVLKLMEGIEMEPIEWLWHGWLARGKFHLIAGTPEAGKTTLGLSFAVTISAGNYWPDGTKAKIGNVLLWTSEDDVADTIKPRLVAMDADNSRIRMVYQARELDGKIRPFDPGRDMQILLDAAKEIRGGVDFLLLDPVVAALGTKANSHNN